MFKRQIVKSCPVVKGSQAVMRVPVDLVREWNGLLRAEADCEWLGLLIGKRSQDGLLIEVEGMIIPQDQERSAAQVTLPEGHEPDGVVGVIHSHHHMQARFSGIDWSTLNNRFWSSIVISYALDGVDDPERWWMGFDYEAVAQIKLPCGALGMVRVEVEVVGGPEDIFWSKTPRQISPEDDVANPGDCPHTKIEIADQWFVKWGMECGIKSRSRPIEGALGKTTARLTELPAPKVWMPASYNGDGKGYQALNSDEFKEYQMLDSLTLSQMTDAQFDRWLELGDRPWDDWEEEKTSAWAGKGWGQEDEVWDAYRRAYFDLQKEVWNGD